MNYPKLLTRTKKNACLHEELEKENKEAGKPKLVPYLTTNQTDIVAGIITLIKFKEFPSSYATDKSIIKQVIDTFFEVRKEVEDVGNN